MPLAPEPRPPALAELEAVIAKAEAERDHYRQKVERLSGKDRRRAEVYLRLAGEHLAQLQRSRDVLLWSGT